MEYSGIILNIKAWSFSPKETKKFKSRKYARCDYNQTILHRLIPNHKESKELRMAEGMGKQHQQAKTD